MTAFFANFSLHIDVQLNRRVKTIFRSGNWFTMLYKAIILIIRKSRILEYSLSIPLIWNRLVSNKILKKSSNIHWLNIISILKILTWGWNIEITHNNQQVITACWIYKSCGDEGGIYEHIMNILWLLCLIITAINSILGSESV